MRYARGYTERIEEFTSLAYERVVEYLPRHNPKAMPLMDYVRWMAKCAIFTEIKGYLRRQELWKKHVETSSGHVGVTHRTPFHDLCESDIFNHAKLTPVEREVVRATFIEGKRNPEIARKLGVFSKSVGPIRARALQKIRTLLTWTSPLLQLRSARRIKPIYPLK